MSVDFRTRLHCDRRALSRDEVFDELIPEALDRHAELAARGLLYKELPALTLEVEDRTLGLEVERGQLRLLQGPCRNGAVAQLDAHALSDLVQDWVTTMGLAMNSRVKLRQGKFGNWVGWEPVFRALFDGRPVHEAGAIDFKARDGSALDLNRSFELGDDLDEVSHFLHEAGFLHIRNVFTEAEMAEVSADLDAALALAKREDGASWWATQSDGAELPVRILFFQEKSDALTSLLQDERVRWLGTLTGDDHGSGKPVAEGLIKPLDIETGLSDLPWHKDCGQGGHSYLCNALSAGISVTGANRVSGALGVVAGSHRANVQTAGKDESLDMPALKLETQTGDLTVHCSDTLHCAHRPVERPRKVVYSGLRLGLKPGDAVEKVSVESQRAARARLTNVQDRIADAGAGAAASEFVDLGDGPS